MSSTNNTPSATTLLVGMLTIAFVVLRLCGVIDWSWWLILSPIIISACIWWVLALIIVVLIAVTRMSNDNERD